MQFVMFYNLFEYRWIKTQFYRMRASNRIKFVVKIYHDDTEKSPLSRTILLSMKLLNIS